MKGSLSNAAFSALRWNYLGFVVRSGSNFVIGIFLARLLGPKPFGQVAVAALVIGVANLLADAGFTSALVQAPDLTKVQIRYVFTLQFLIAVALTLACFGAAGTVARSFHDPAIRGVIFAISPIFLLQAIGQTSSALLRRELAFRSLQTAQVSSYLAGYLLVGIPLALLGAGVWSLVAAQLSQSLLYSAQLYLRVRHSVLPSLDLSGARLLRFGSKVTVANIANWGISNLDNAVIGRTFGSTSLGLYSRAFNLASSPSDGIVSTAQQVLFASCSRAEQRMEPIRRAYLASLSAIAIVIFPAFWAMSACAATVTVGLYGEKWRAAAVLFRPLVLAVSINAVMAIAGPILASVDQVKREITAQTASLGVALIVFGITSRYSPTVLSWGVVGVYLFRFFAATRPTLAVLHLRWIQVARVLLGPTAVALLTAVALYGTDALLLRSGLKPFSALCVLGICGAVLFAAALFFFGHLIMTPPLVALLRTGTAGMPRAVTRIFLRVVDRGAPNPEVSQTRPIDSVGARPIYIATIQSQTGETGVHTHFNTLKAYLKGLHTHVFVCTPYETPRYLRRLVGVVRRSVLLFNRGLATYVRDTLYAKLLWYRLREVLPADKPWIIYAQCPASSLVAESFRKRKDQSVVLVTHFNISQADEMVERRLIPNGGWVYRKCRANERASLLGADRIVYVSEFMRTHLLGVVEGLHFRTSLVLPNFVFKPRRSADGAGGDLVTVGTLEPRKNHIFLLHMLAVAKRLGKHYTLTIFGIGVLDSFLRKSARDLGIEDQVIFAGYVTNAAEQLHRYRVYVHAAKIENLPISVIEALASGIPVIAAPVGGIPEILTEGSDGLFWNIEDPEAAAHVVIGLLEDETRRMQMGRAASERYELSFSAEKIAPELHRFLVGDERDAGDKPVGANHDTAQRETTGLLI